MQCPQNVSEREASSPKNVWKESNSYDFAGESNYQTVLERALDAQLK